MLVRPMENGDHGTFLKLCEDFYNSCATIRDFDKDLAEKTWRYLMDHHENLWGYLFSCKDTGEPIGYALITSYWCNEDGGNVIILDELYVDGEYRHNGYGRLFLDWLEREFRDKAVSITLEVLTTNTVAKDLYSKFGFTEDGFEVLTKKL